MKDWGFDNEDKPIQERYIKKTKTSLNKWDKKKK